MSVNTSIEGRNKLGTATMLVHLGLMVSGMAAVITGPLAEDYKHPDFSGYSLHSWLGAALAIAAVVRLWRAVAGPVEDRFYSWIPLSAGRLRQVREDLAGLMRLQLPERPARQGVAGLVQAMGLLGFFFMAMTGSALYFVLEPGSKATGLAHDIKELHEVGVLLVLPFLALHIGAVITHALCGKQYWKQAFFIAENDSGVAGGCNQGEKS